MSIVIGIGILDDVVAVAVAVGGLLQRSHEGLDLVGLSGQPGQVGLSIPGLDIPEDAATLQVRDGRQRGQKVLQVVLLLLLGTTGHFVLVQTIPGTKGQEFELSDKWQWPSQNKRNFQNQTMPDFFLFIYLLQWKAEGISHTLPAPLIISSK